MQAERFEQGGLGGEDVVRRGVVVEVAEQHDQAAHERRVGVAGEMRAAVLPASGDPRGGDAAADAVGFGAGVGGERRAGFGAVDDEREAFLRVVDDEEVVDHLLLFLGERHAGDGAAAGGGLQAARAAALVRRVNIFVVSWFWRGLRGHSVTFSALFASFVLGVSISGGVKHLLGALGVHWLYVLILPVVFFTWMNTQEAKWLPDEKRRRTLARALLFGSAVLAILINQIRHW